jgi:RNA polymerase sigma-54 factor
MLAQNLQHKLLHKTSPQQILTAELVQVPILLLEQKILEELENNPALESEKEISDTNSGDCLNDDALPNYRTHINNYTSDQQPKNTPYISGISFNQHLITQLQNFTLDKQEYAIAAFLVGSIDQNGYLLRTPSDIVDDLAFIEKVYATEGKIKNILSIIQQLDPVGVGARNLQECILIQLERKKQTQNVKLAVELIKNAFDLFSKKEYQLLIQKFTVSQTELKNAIREITSLNPKPGSVFSENSKLTQYIIPDFIITIEQDSLELTLNSRNIPELYISKSYQNMLKTYKETSKKTTQQKQIIEFILDKLDIAKKFITAINERKQTLYITMNAIMNYQKEYFLSGDILLLKPMLLKDIYNIIGMDISTVSRVANSK